MEKEDKSGNSTPRQKINGFSYYNINKKTVILFVLFILILTGLMARFTFGYTLSYSPTSSMPYHFFIEKIGGVTYAEKGTIVSFIMPKSVLKYQKWYLSSNLWYPPGSSFVKYVGCVAGSVLNTISRKTYCNGKLITTVPHYADLYPFKHNKITAWQKWHDYTIPNNLFFAMGPDKYSLDSRYFGLINIKTINGIGFGL